MLANILIVLLSLAAVGNSIVRSASHARSPGLNDVMDTIVYLLAGPMKDHFVVVLFTIALFAAVIVGGIACRRTRSLTIAFLVFPFGTAFLVSHLMHPIWLERNFAFTVPFLAIVLTYGIENLALGVRPAWVSPIKYGALTAIGVALLAMSSMASPFFSKATNYQSIAATLSGKLTAGDLVYVPDQVSFWGVAWYLIGPDWGSPLKIQDVGTLEPSDKWYKVLAKLGPDGRRRLHLEPEGRTVHRGSVAMVIGATPPNTDNIKRVWLVSWTSSPDDSNKLPGFVQRQSIDYDDLTVHLLTHEFHDKP